LWDKFLKRCNDPKAFLTKKCDYITDEMFNQFGHGINPYALDYPVCLDDNQEFDDEIKKRPKRRLGAVDTTSTGKPVRTTSAQLSHLMNLTRAGPPITSKENTDYQPCAEKHLMDFLDTPAVRKAFHVDPSITTPWQKCGGIDYSEDDVDTPTTDLYQELVAGAIAGTHNLNMMIFSGDDDSICSTAGTQYWIWGLGAESASIWNPWSVLDQTAGFVTHFDLGPDTEAKFTFVTVHGAGHEVPAYKPVEALQMFRNYFSGVW
jgi:hypothetical protein